MSMNPTTFSKDVSRYIFQPAIYKALQDPAWDWKKVFTIKKSNRASEAQFGSTPLGTAKIRGVNQEVPYLDMEELAETTWTHVAYMLGYMLPDILIDDGKYVSHIENGKKALAQAHKNVRDLLAAGVFDNAFDGTNYPMWDGNALCSDSHVATKTGTSIDNYLGNASLDWGTLWDAMMYFEYGMVDEAGLFYTKKAAGIVFHPSKWPEVLKAGQPDWEPDTGYRNTNTLTDRYGKLDYVACPMLTAVTSVYPWFVYDEEFKASNIFWEREAPHVEKDSIFNTYAFAWRSRQRVSAGPNDYRDIAGSAG